MSHSEVERIRAEIVKLNSLLQRLDGKTLHSHLSPLFEEFKGLEYIRWIVWGNERTGGNSTHDELDFMFVFDGNDIHCNGESFTYPVPYIQNLGTRIQNRANELLGIFSWDDMLAMFGADIQITVNRAGILTEDYYD